MAAGVTSAEAAGEITAAHLLIVSVGGKVAAAADQIVDAILITVVSLAATKTAARPPCSSVA